MTPSYLLHHTIPAAFSLLPAKMDTRESRALLIATALQESALKARTQRGGGPARGLWQFEKIGVLGVLTHPRSRELAAAFCSALLYPAAVPVIYEAIADNDALLCGLSRLLLWTLPGPLARRDQPEAAWSQYIAAWKPGKPRHEAWAGNLVAAWAEVDAYE